MSNIIAAMIKAIGGIVESIIKVNGSDDAKSILKVNRILSILVLVLCFSNIGMIAYFVLHESDTPPEPTSNVANTSSEIVHLEKPLNTTAPVDITHTQVPTEISNVESNIPYVVLGTIYTLGHYEQDGISSNGTEAIEWIAITQKGNQILLVAKQGLDSRQYHHKSGSVDWENSSIREWLNGTFFHTVFSDDEKSRIIETENIQHTNVNDKSCDQGSSTKDNVFLLSTTEYDEYMYDNGNIEEWMRFGTPTATTSKKGIDKYGQNEYCWWWLRTSAKKNEFACSVNAFGRTDYGSRETIETGGMIRPAIWITVE